MQSTVNAQTEKKRGEIRCSVERPCMVAARTKRKRRGSEPVFGACATTHERRSGGDGFRCEKLCDWYCDIEYESRFFDSNDDITN